MLFYTGIKRTAADVAKSYVDEIECNKRQLRIMKDLVTEGISVLSSGNDIRAFGELLHEAWLAKASLAPDISNDVIRKMYAAALENGAIGGKLLGAGGGGFLLLFAPPERHAKLKAVFADKQEIKVRLNAPGAEIIL